MAHIDELTLKEYEAECKERSSLVHLNIHIMNAPESKDGCTVMSGRRALVPVTMVRNAGTASSPSYQALIHDHKVNAPHDNEWPEGEVWRGFVKNQNKHVKIPVLKPWKPVEIKAGE